jgi:hypothetical protein
VTGLALNRREGLVLVQAVAGNAAVPDELMTEVLERADGVPLFVEELTKAVLETVDRNGQTAALAAAPPAMLAVPATLNASLIARLDRVGPSDKEIAQVGAVLGREFGQAPTEPALVITVSQRARRPPEGPYRRAAPSSLRRCFWTEKSRRFSRAR